MFNLKDYGAETRAAGLSAADIAVLAKVLEEFMRQTAEVYDGRKGTVIIDAQPMVMQKKPDGELASMRNFSYGAAAPMAEFDLLAGPSRTIFFDSKKVATEAINSFLEGRRFFVGHANASLNGNIYKTSGTDKTIESGHLMILNTLYGRLLVGCGDVMADTDKSNEHDFILVAIARVIAKLFPDDTEVQASFDWIRRTSSINYYLFEMIVLMVDEIMNAATRDDPAGVICRYWWKREEALCNDRAAKFLPFV